MFYGANPYGPLVYSSLMRTPTPPQARELVYSLTTHSLNYYTNRKKISALSESAWEVSQIFSYMLQALGGG